MAPFRGGDGAGDRGEMKQKKGSLKMRKNGSVSEEVFWYAVKCGNCGKKSKLLERDLSRAMPGASWEEFRDAVFTPIAKGGHLFFHCEWCRFYAPGEVIGFCPDPEHVWKNPAPLK